MASYYTVVQYVPDAIADERINIGVIVAGEGKVRVRFLNRWGRVKQFSGNRDISFLQEFGRRLEDASYGQLMLPHPDLRDRDLLSEEILRSMIDGWGGSIQFTPTRGSLDSHDDLLDTVSSRFLREHVRPPPKFRGRREVANLTIENVKDALETAVGPDVASHVLKRRSTTHGRVYHHTLDAVVSNGRMYYAAHGLSYENPDQSVVEHDMQTTLWAIRDIRDSIPDLPIGIVLFPPLVNSRTRRFRNDIDALKKVGADTLVEQEIASWAQELSSAVSPGLRAASLLPENEHL